MSTLKSSSENLTLNADGANNDIIFQSNGSTKATLDQAGVISSTGGSTHADNVKAKFGTGNDLEIYHDGSDSIIRDAGTGALEIRSNELKIKNAAGNENAVYFAEDGAVNLYHNNAAKLVTTATGIDVTGAITVGGTALASGISEADQWRLTSNVTLGNDLVSWLTANWERVDTDGFGKLGTGLTESSGVFSFPSTGVWLITFDVNGHCFNTHTRYYNATLYTTTNNSTYDSASLAQTNGYNSGAGTYISASCTFIFDVTDVTTHKFKMQVLSIGGGFVQSSTSSNRTAITAIKLGDT